MPDTLSQAARFATVGILATAVHAGTFVLLNDLAHIGPIPSTVFAFLFALAVSYRLNYAWSFQARTSHFRSIAGYTIVAVFGAILNAALMHLAVHRCHLRPIHGLFAALLVLPPLSYLCNRFCIFRSNAQPPQI